MTRVACAAIALLLLQSSPATAAEGDDPGSEGDDAGEGQGEAEQFDVGRFYLGAVYSFGVGSTFLDGDSVPMKEVGIGAGLNLGVKVPSARLWWELGVTVGPFATRGHAGEGPCCGELSEGDNGQQLDRLYGASMPFYLELRFLAPIKGPYLYWASSFLPGFFIHELHTYNAEYDIEITNTTLSFSATLRTGLAFILGDWVEIRLDLVGMELIFEKAFGVLYSPSFAIVLRI